MSTLDPKITSAVTRILQSGGHRKATTRNIALEAGISQSTLFRLYGDKKGLLRHVFKKLHPDGPLLDLSALLGRDDIVDGLAFILQEYLAVILRYLPAAKLAMQFPDDPDFSTDPDAVFAPYMEQFANHLHNLYAQKRIAQADFKALSQLVFSALLMHAPEMAAGGEDNGRHEEAVNRMAWKYATLLERKLKIGHNGIAEAPVDRRRESRSSDMRENNLRAVLRTFIDADKLSAPDVQKEVHLSKTTIIKLIGQLVEDGMLLDLGIDSAVDERGRPPSYYRLNRDFAYGVVIQFAPEIILTAVTNMKNEIIHIAATPITDDLAFDEALNIIVTSFHAVISSLGIRAERVLGLCVATGGPTNEVDGTIAYLPRYHNWPKNAPLKRSLRERLPDNLNIITYNEMYCQSIGEQYFGKAYGRASAIIFEAGERLGSGIILDHRLLPGAHSIAGEIGHIKLDPHSTVQCVCGAYGCFRALVHSDRIVVLAREGLSRYPDSILGKAKPLTAHTVFSALEAGDRLATEVMEQMARWMGLALSNLILTVDPEIIVLQGIYTEAGPTFLAMMRKHIVKDSFPYLGELKHSIEFSTLGGNACLLGGSKLVTESIIDDYCRQG